MDVFDYLSDTMNREDSVDTQYKIQDRLYGFPEKNKEARYIWDDCDFTHTERESYIRNELWHWVRIFAIVEHKESEIWIEWVLFGNRHIAKWTTFVHWFLLCCTPYKN